MRPVNITDTTLRDAHQSLWATRMTIGDMLPILDKLDTVGFWSLESWGGATFDTCLRFLDENPWERLRTIRAHCPKTRLQMLLRGQNLLGYHHYSDDVVRRFVFACKRNGIDVIRNFDALNDIRNLKTSAEAMLECGAHFQGAISYTISPVHTIDSYLDYAAELKELGAQSIVVKDMAGMLTPFRTEKLVKALVDEIGLPVSVHCHYIGGMAPMNYIKAVEAGATTFDSACVALAFGNSQPATETMVAALQESPWDSGLDLDLLFEIAEYWEEVREVNHIKRGTTSLLSLEVFSHQVPGGMMSNLISQLEVQNAKDRLPEVLKEIAVVRAEVGYPPLVTPMSQIVGTQAVLNVLTGKRWDIVPQEMRDYLLGYYGKAPAPLNAEVMAKVLGDEKPLDPKTPPSTLAKGSYEEAAEELGDLARSEEDVLMYALFPNEAHAYLSKHREGVENAVFMMADEARVVREDEGDMDVKQISELIKQVEESDVAEIIIEEGDNKITLRKAGAIAAAAPVVAPSSAPASSATPAPIPAPSSQAPGAESPDVSGGRSASWKAVASPMVGTFYASASPEAAVFVELDSEFAAGDTLCIIEAMKLMNEIKAEEAGVIREVCVDNAALVEYGAPLFYYEAL